MVNAGPQHRSTSAGDPLRVLYVTHYPELYGANRSMLDLMLELRGRGVVMPHVLLPRKGPLIDVLEEEGIPWAVFPFQPWMSERHYEGGPHHRLMQWLRYTRAARRRDRADRDLMPVMTDRVRSWGIRLMHANSSAVGIAPELASECLIPFVWHIRELPERQYLLHLDRGRKGYGRALREADRLIAISQAVRQDILRYTTPHRPIAVIYNGVLRGERYAVLREQAQDRWQGDGPFTLALVGLIHPSKGHIEALEALHLLRSAGHDVRLIIAGDGRDRDVLQRIQDLGLQDAVELPGFVSDPYVVFLRAHALLMCSRNEAMGRVTVEAMASGLPVIGHNSGGTPELVQDGVNGLLYPGGAQALADRILRLVNDRVLARSLGEKASRLSEERFTVEHYAEEVLKVYRSVISSR